MGKKNSRRGAKNFLALLNDNETSLYWEVTRESNRFQRIAKSDNPEGREYDLIEHYDFMIELLGDVQKTQNPALILAAEYTMLQRDERHLKELAEHGGVDRFLQADITGNRKGVEAVGAALGALYFQSENNEIYHSVIDVGAPPKAFDAQHLVIDVVRDAAKTQASRLRLDMRGLNQTGLDRKKCAFLAKRHENLIVCENIYKTLQKGAKQNRDANDA